MTRRLVALVFGWGLAFSATAQVSAGADLVVRDAWIRATVPGQKVTGLFMRIESAKPTTLIGVDVATSVAGGTEIHETVRDKDMARMQRVERVDIASGKALALAPGGYHVMLLDLPKALKAGESVPVTLKFVQSGTPREVAVNAAVRPLGQAAAEHLHAGH